MIGGFARIDIAACDPEAATAAWRRALGAAEGATLSLANATLRMVPVAAGGVEGIARLVFAVDDVEAAATLLARRGAPATGEGDERAVAAEASHGIEIAIATAPVRPPARAAAGALSALDHVVIRTAAPDRALAFYGTRLGLDLRLERSNPAWGARLFFFRCGDAVVEIGAPIEAADSPDPDRFGGVAVRAADPAAARARLAAQGFDVSEVRAGRKAGTAVFTLRSGLPGAPVLVIGTEPP